ncbi:MAG: PEGA domain-containing protein, partial [Spirochaetota bacterium]
INSMARAKPISSLNGAYKGISTLVIEYLPEGASVMAEADGYESNEIKNISRKQAAAGLSFSLKEKGDNIYIIKISSDPAGANVTVDNEEKGKTPVEFPVVGSSVIRVRVKKFGHDEVFEEVNIKDKASSADRKTVELNYKLD